MLILMVPDRTYPIRELEENIPRETYRYDTNIWMDSQLFADWLSEPCIFKPLPDNRTRVLRVGNSTVNEHTSSAMESLQYSMTELICFQIVLRD